MFVFSQVIRYNEVTVYYQLFMHFPTTMKILIVAMILYCLLMRVNCHPKCKLRESGDKKGFHLAMMGYDPSYANPFSASGDPGFRQGRIFDHSCTLNNKVGYYDFITVASDYNCQPQAKAWTIRSFEELVLLHGEYLEDADINTVTTNIGFSK